MSHHQVIFLLANALQFGPTCIIAGAANVSTRVVKQQLRGGAASIDSRNYMQQEIVSAVALDRNSNSLQVEGIEDHKTCGNYCGPNYCNGVLGRKESQCFTQGWPGSKYDPPDYLAKPIDSVDACCQMHDYCCHHEDSPWANDCNKNIAECIETALRERGSHNGTTWRDHCPWCRSNNMVTFFKNVYGHGNQCSKDAFWHLPPFLDRETECQYDKVAWPVEVHNKLGKPFRVIAKNGCPEWHHNNNVLGDNKLATLTDGVPYSESNDQYCQYDFWASLDDFSDYLGSVRLRWTITNFGREGKRQVCVPHFIGLDDSSVHHSRCERAKDGIASKQAFVFIVCKDKHDCNY